VVDLAGAGGGENGSVMKWPLLRRSDPLPRLSWRAQAFDVALALGLAIVAIRSDGGDSGQTYTFDGPAPPAPPVPPVDVPVDSSGDLLQAAVMLLVAAPLALRRRYPLGMLLLVIGMSFLGRDDHAVLRLSFYACVLTGYSAAVYSPYALPAIAALPVAAVLYSKLQSDLLPTVPDESVPYLILIPIAVAAHGLRRWKSHAADLKREQAEAMRRATEHERARIARDLHDVVTHNVSMMVIQAGAARQVLTTAPDQTREALLAVEAGGRAALAELRHVMGLLTVDGESAAELAPRPGLDGLDALVARVREAGVPVELTVTGPARPLPEGIELAAYRVAQEALTNSVKHAAGATATVVVEYGAEHVRVEVTDTGGAAAESAATGNRRGLIGLRERVAVYGGTLHTGPRPRGGYRVTAVIPVEAV
jgi:signal transduction histidine kinase